MAELIHKERLQPYLLDRLTDDEPHQTVESREQRTATLQRLRQAVLRDLTWLLNACHLAASQDLSDYPEVERSVLNYGLPDLTGQHASRLASASNILEHQVRQAVMQFEPRFSRDNLKVKVLVDEQQMNSNTLAFEIEAEMWAQPAPLFLRLRTEIDLYSGDAMLEERGGVVTPKSREGGLDAAKPV